MSSDAAIRIDKAKLARHWQKILLFVGMVVIAGMLYWQFGDQLLLQSLAEKETQLRQIQTQSPLLVFGLAFLVYVVVTGLSLPGAAALTLLYGWYFKLLAGVVLVSFASTTGATLAFLLSRFLFRDAIEQKFGERLKSFHDSLEREGPFFLLTLRLIPAVPFFIVNAVMGLTPIRTRTFWWASQLGMLAGTIVYVYAGASVPDLATLAEKGVNAAFSTSQMIQVFLAFVLLGTFPWIARCAIRLLSKESLSKPDGTTSVV